MIDIHAHLEQPSFSDREEVIKNCKEKLKAVVTSCAHPKDLDLTLELVKKYRNFVFCTTGIHPEYIKDIKGKDDFLERVKRNRSKISGIGEIGLDYFWVKESKWQEKQRELFRDMLDFAKEIEKPVVIHSRDAFRDSLDILEEKSPEKVDLHMFGKHKYLDRIMKNNWSVSFNAIVLKSKEHKKLARDLPLENIMLETDAPWIAPDPSQRNDPITIIKVAEKIAKIKKIDFDEVWNKCGMNAIKFFDLKF